MIEGVLWFEIFDLGILGGRKILASIFLRFFGVFKTNVSIFCVMSFNAPWKFLWLGNWAWDFWGVKFWSRDFLGFCLKPYGFFRVLIFAPIRSSLSLEIRSTPLGIGSCLTFLFGIISHAWHWICFLLPCLVCPSGIAGSYSTFFLIGISLFFILLIILN